MSGGLIGAACRLRSAIIAAIVLAVLAFPSAANAADPSVTITYKGTLTEKYVAKVSDPSDYEEELTLKWEETATDDAVTEEPIAPPSFSISGSVHLTSEHLKPNASCTGTFSTRPGPYGNSPAGFLGGGIVSVSAVMPDSGKYVQSSGVEHCAVAPNSGVGVGGAGVSDSEFTAAIAPIESFPESQSVYTRPFSVPDVVDRRKAPNGTEESENTLSLSATLTATTTVDTGPQGFHPSSPKSKHGASPSHKPLTLGKATRKAKEQARRDLPEALKEAWAAHGLLALAGLTGDPLVQIADELGQKAGPLAGNDATTRILDDLRIYDDPPLSSVRVLAQPGPVKAPALPACTQSQGSSQLTYCLGLRAAYVGLLTADGEAAADDTALERTVSRASAAARARNAGALALQEAHVAGLEAAFSKALAAKGPAAASVRALLLQARSQWTLSRNQSVAAIGWLKRRLAHSGVRASVLMRLAGGALRPGKIDVLALF